jgi:hypothetical protein
MGKRGVKLTEEQKKINEAILSRLEAERSQLVEETRAMQEQTGRKPTGKKKRSRATTAVIKDSPE